MLWLYLFAGVAATLLAYAAYKYLTRPRLKVPHGPFPVFAGEEEKPSVEQIERTLGKLSREVGPGRKERWLRIQLDAEDESGKPFLDPALPIEPEVRRFFGKNIARPDAPVVIGKTSLGSPIAAVWSGAGDPPEPPADVV